MKDYFIMLNKEKIKHGGKWEKYFNLPEIQEIRTKIIEAYSNKLVFEEEPHEYFLDGVKYVSVSELTHRFKPITGEQMAENCVRKWKTDNDTSYKYYGMSKEEILAQWKTKSDAACEFGTNVHAFGESMFYYMTGQYDKILEECADCFDENGPHPANPQEEAIVKFWNDLPENFVPVLAETKVFNRNGTQYAGTFDILFYYLEKPYSPNNGLVIFDYKGLDINTPILTKEGWKTMGTVQEGDIVYDGDGNETSIIHTSEIHNNKCYKFHFDNGVEVVADDEHNWLVNFVRQPNKKHFEKIMTSHEIFEFVKTHTRRDTINIPKIKSFGGINGSTVDLKIDPYVLGVWLGDGHSSCGMVTNMYDEIFNEIERRGFKIGKDVSQGGAGKAKSRTIYGLSPLLRYYKLLNNKHIPYEYLISPKEVKMDILKGLMDTDGYYNPKRKRYVLSTTRKYQAFFSIELLSSIGIKPTLIKCKKSCNGKRVDGFDVTFTTKEYPFLIRKINVEKPKSDKTSYIVLKSVEEAVTIPTRCIQVDSPTHTFVFGNNMMITHNTNEDLYKNFKGTTLLEPFDDMLDMNVSYYTLQLSLYTIPLQNLGMKVLGRRLIWVRPDGNYEKIKLESVAERLRHNLNIPSADEIITKELL